MSEKVLVVGGSGFLGSHIADALTEAGYDVSIFDIRESPWLRKSQKMIIGDVMSDNDLATAIKGKKYVYHLAGIADIGAAARNPELTLLTNIIGSTKVINSCMKASISRVLLASTIYVYSDQGSFYRVSKQTIESILESFNKEYGQEYTILRFGSLYGPRSQDWNGIKKYVSQAIKEKKIEYSGTGGEKREFIHVVDAARLSVEALAPQYANQCLNLTGTQVLTISEVLEMINEVLGGSVDIRITSTKESIHYGLTPYRFTPKPAKKIIPNIFCDIGQGILDLVEEVYHQQDSDK